MSQRIPYSEIKPTLQTGDKVLMSGSSRFSHQIKFWTRSRWSHVGMIVRRGEEVFLWHSCAKVELVSFDDEFIKPVPMIAALGFVEGEIGDVAIRRLILPAGFDREAMERKLDEFILEANGRPYEENDTELALALLGAWGNRQECLDSYFCSELMAESDQRMGLLTLARPSNTYRQADYADGGGLEYLGGAYLAPELLLEGRCA